MAVILIDSYLHATSSSSLRLLYFSIVDATKSSSSSVLRLTVISKVSTSTGSSPSLLYFDSWIRILALPSIGSSNREVINLVTMDGEDVVVHSYLLGLIHRLIQNFLLTVYTSISSSRSWHVLGAFYS